MRVLVAMGGVLGATGVAAGAFGAHALRDVLAGPAGDTWRTAVLYHLTHAVVLVALGALAPAGAGAALSPRLIGFAGALFAAGIVCFSGSLYWLALGGPSLLGPVTPLGGLLLIAGWATLAVAAARG